METGKLNRRITIQSIPTIQNADGEDVKGEPIDEWPNVAARFLDIAGREFEQARQMSAELAGIVEIRYRPGITPRHCIAYMGRRLNIIAVVDPREQHEVLLLHYKEAA